jgi:UDP-N-acetylmuramoyl-tripeptide--D-alanyl-D-alanine ligase
MITLEQARRATGGSWLRQPLPEGTPLRGGAFDTRDLSDADIFFALRGERADGHDFLARLDGSAVKLAVVARPVDAPRFGGAVLRVTDTLDALGRMARFLADAFRPKIVAITGSHGKTTAKEVVAHVLAGRRRVLHSPGSLNNEIGVPIALLGLDGSQDTCVLEFSARKAGDIAYLGAIAPPDIAVVTAIGHAHVGVFGSVEAIYRAKAEIFRFLRPGGLALVNGEDARLIELAAGHRTLSFGRRGDYRAEGIETDGAGRQSFTGVHGAARLAFRSEISGAHGLYPILIAWAVARELGVPDEDVAARAGRDPGLKGRAMTLKGPGGATLLDDTYNASPETVRNLIATLASLAEPEKILVLGRLAELEEGLAESAALIGEALRPPLSDVYVHAPGQAELFAGLQAAARGVRLHAVAGQPELIGALRDRDRPGTAIGLKAARSAHLERVVHGLLGARIDCALSPCPLLKHCTDCEAMTRHD